MPTPFAPSRSRPAPRSLSLQQRTLGLVGVVLALGLIAFGIVFLSLQALDQERAMQHAAQLFLEADRHRQEFLRNQSLSYAYRADEALVRTDSALRLVDPSLRLTPMADSIEAYRDALHHLLRTAQQRGLQPGFGREGRFRIVADVVERTLRSEGRPALLAAFLSVRMDEQTFMRSGNAEEAAAVRDGIRRLREQVDRAALPPPVQRHLQTLFNDYLAQFDLAGTLVHEIQRMDRRMTLSYRSLSAQLERMAQHERALAERYQRAAVLALLLTALLGIGLAGWMGRTLVAPILTLQHKAHRIARGEEDVRVGVPPSAGRELRNLARALETVRDHVAERRRVERALRTSQRFTETVLAGLKEGVVVYDRALRYRLLNPHLERLTGVATSEVLGRTASEVFPQHYRNGLDALLRRALEGETMRSGDLFFQHPATDRSFWYVGTYSPLRGAEGAVIGVIGSIHDITERKRAERQLIEAKEQAEELARLKTSFLNNMSHEIRTPLTSILGFADVLVEETEDESRQFARFIHQSAQRLMDTLNAVLDLSQIEAGKMELACRPVRLRDEVEEAARLFAPQAVREGLGLRSVIEAPEAVAVVDPGSLTRILNNLLSNALKFTEEGCVTVRLAARGERWLISVEDTGPGLDPAFVPHLFEEFRQASTGLRRDHEGSGLGLSIVRRLTEMMGGEVSVETTPGEGSTFAVAFPAWQPDAGEAPERTPDVPLPALLA